ncbi:MAG: hypothetical protein SFV15_24530 [Polyangiaceae bacterium]|nr:hypothetical protein [Polyangiaceae bacterium]
MHVKKSLLRWSNLPGLAALGGVVVALSSFACGPTATQAAPAAPAVAAQAAAAPVAPKEQAQVLPADSEYVIAKDGHLTVAGQRQRFWAVIGKTFLTPHLENGDSAEVRKKKIETARHGTDVLQQRFQDLGFNANRLWESLPNTEDYQVGDGSHADSVDYFIAQMKKRGSRIWVAALNNVGNAKAEDVNVLEDPSTAEAWKKAVKESGDEGMGLRGNLARAWDPRLEALHIQRMKAIAMHTNKHTGLRWADDPVMAVWELSNEEWWMMHMLGGQWQRLPSFFKNALISQWNTWLQKKYGSDEKLKAAWSGVLPGETLGQSTVILTPMAGDTSASTSMNDANPYAKKALEGLKQKYSRADFAPARGADVLEFLLQVQLSHKQRMAAAVKTWGKSTRLSPLVYDTGIGYEIQSQYMHQQADAVAHDAYVNGMGPKYKKPKLDKLKNETQRMLKTLDAERISANSGPWVNWLQKPPGISQGVPWLEHNRVEGKPYLAYETQIMQPAKYRADFPLRLAALAAIQDWDWICWHYFSPEEDVATAARPFDKPMDITTGSHPQGYHFTYDEVQNATMRAASSMFRGMSLKPAPNPTKFIFGRKSLHDPDSMDYGGSYGPKGMDMLQTVYQYGVRLQIDPTREDDQVIGPVVSFADRLTHNPYNPTDEIVFDWKKGYLSLQSPSAAAFTGLLANYGKEVKFNNGVTLSQVKIVNPKGIFEPITDKEKYISFVFYTGGEPLATAKRASISLVSTSFNTGFKIEKNLKKGGDDDDDEKITAGGLPVLTARVGATVEAEALRGMSYTFRDWHMQEIGKGTISGNTLEIPADKPIFVIELTRP